MFLAYFRSDKFLLREMVPKVLVYEYMLKLGVCEDFMMIAAKLNFI